MNLLDASALIALLMDEPGAEMVEQVLRERPAGMVSVNLAEAAELLTRRRGVPIADVRRAVEALPRLSLLPVGSEAGWRAAELRARHYHRARCSVSMGDCLLIAMASDGDRVVSSDGDLLAVARREGVDVLELPSSDG